MSAFSPESTLEPPIEIELGDQPSAAVIWLHGLGADGHDFEPIVPELGLTNDANIRFIFPHAPVRPVTCNGGYEMRAWYDIYSLGSMEQQDEAGFQHSRALIEALIAKENQRGIASERIILMGFSQGGALSLYAGLRHAQTLAGIGALSCYLPLAEQTAQELHAANAHTPIFMAHGTADPVVSFHFGKSSRDRLQELGYTPEWHAYPMQHSVCMEEIEDIGSWISMCLDKNGTKD